MTQMTLNGQWTLSKGAAEENIPAMVPGCVHLDLLAAEKIPDPYYRDNELALMCIGETDWVYKRHFTVAGEFLTHKSITLRCHGLDTLATIMLNDIPVAKTENMFRTYEFDVKPYLFEGENTIRVYFQAAMPFVREKQAQRRLPAWTHDKLEGGNWLRKEPCNFGWDWGPRLVTCGIWRDIELIGSDDPMLVDVLVLQRRHETGSVELDLTIQLDGVPVSEMDVHITLSKDEEIVSTAVVSLADETVRATLFIEHPALWWPAGMGEQPLYDLVVELNTGSGKLVDRWKQRVGLRTLRLERQKDRWGESFFFEANGVPFFAKGANWIPADSFARRVTPSDYERLLKDAVAANMNMLRVWGGGIYEEDIFYDLCDELGICIWQDFMFACATYPTFDEDFMANVKVEAEQNVRRIRHHACLTLWCGNNELEQGLTDHTWTEKAMSWDDYSLLFDELLPEVVKRLDPQRDYWPSSAHSPLGERANWNNPTCGDAHLWDVWHGKQPFEWYRTSLHHFVSEFGFQSFPEPRTVETFTIPEDRNITSRIMEHHQRSRIGNSTIIHYMLDWFRLPTSFEMTLWLSQILQGMAIKYAVEHWRRRMPQCMGALYWQLNDCWPVASWASIDTFGRWKALHYMAKDFYAPVLISGVEDSSSGSVDVHLTNDRREHVSGVMAWSLVDVEGDVIEHGHKTVRIAPQQNALPERLQLGAHLDKAGMRRRILSLQFLENGQVISQNLVLFERPKHLELQPPAIRVEQKISGGRETQLTLTTDKPALWVWLEIVGCEARFSKNFFHLIPGAQAVEVTILLDETLSEIELQQRLRVRSLTDTYS
jgi:beta-mannosidase